MTVAELIKVLSEFDGTEIVCTAMAPGDPRDLPWPVTVPARHGFLVARIATGQVYGMRVQLDEDDEFYNVVIIEW
jgi:hypothetical protein